MRKCQLFYIVIVCLFLSGCPPTFLPGSRPYQAADWEKKLIDESNKLVMPSDILNDPEEYKNELIHWVGIIDTFYVEDRDSLLLAKIYFDQKYYDYIEDYSIQREIFFISPYGEGKFITQKVYKNLPADSLVQIFNSGIRKGNLGFCYGIFKSIESGKPLLEGLGLRVIEEQFYSTEYMNYKVLRDSSGKVVAGPDGYPSLTDIKIERSP